jgi:hypothetical protein
VPSIEGAQAHLLRAQELLAQRDYEGSRRENEEVLSVSAGKPPGDQALFGIAMIWADPLNPGADHGKSLASLQTLMADYPGGPWAERARVMADAMKRNNELKRASAEAVQENQKLKQENERLKQASSETSQENEKLKRASAEAVQENQKLKRLSVEASQEIQKLKRIVEESRQVDIEIDEKKRSQAK